MSKDQFDLKLEAIEALTKEETVEPTMPVAVALQEAEDLYHWCQPDKEGLIKAGLDPVYIEDLPARTGACRYAQSAWQKEYKSPEDFQKEWVQKSPAAFALRDEMLHHFFHAYRKYPTLLSSVQKIAEGDSNADMIQDLSDMAVLGTANFEPLKAIGIEMSYLTLAAETSASMADLLAQANGDRRSTNKLKVMRDKAYTHMKQAVDEIRHHGQYLFWRNENRKKGYVSKYLQNQNAKNQNGTPKK